LSGLLSNITIVNYVIGISALSFSCAEVPLDQDGSYALNEEDIVGSIGEGIADTFLGFVAVSKLFEKVLVGKHNVTVDILKGWEIHIEVRSPTPTLVIN